MDFNIRLKKGQILRGFINSPGEKLRAVVIMVHGLGEHILRYKNWAGLFNESMIGFAGVDLPGHGRSDGKRGHISSFALTDEMIDILLGECRKTFPATPLFLYGHSLGGGIVLDYLVRKDPGIKGAIVTSPWLKLGFQPPEAKVMLAGIMKHIYPGMLQPTGLVAEHLSHDQKIVSDYRKDPLVHDKISVSLFHSTMSAASNTLRNAGLLKKPLLLIHGKEDQICSPAGSSEFASGTRLAELRLWDGGYHELHNDFCRDEVFKFIADWINARLQ